mgnify:CR=1 FL=1
MRTRRKDRWLPKQPRLGARMCQGTFFFITAAVQSDAGRTVQTSSPPTASPHTALSLPCTPGKYLQNPLVPSAQPHTDAEKRHFQNGNTNFCNPG